MAFLRWLYTVPLRLRSLLRRNQVDRELDDELQYHVERQIEQNIARGMTPGEARTSALRAMGRMGHYKEECRDTRRINFADDLLYDVRYAFRTLVRQKSFAAVAVLSLAIGIGANTAVFSVIDPLLLRPLPVPDPYALVLVSTPPPNTPSFSISYPVFRRLQEQNQVFSSVTASLLLGGRQLVASGLLLRTLHNFRSLDPGFDRQHTLRFEVDRGQAPQRSPQEWMQTFNQLVDRLKAYPSVRSASVMASLGFLRGARSSGNVQVPGSAAPDEGATCFQMFVGPGFFAASGITLLSGREIQPEDERPGSRVAIVNQAMAKYFFGNDDVLGKHFRFENEAIEVIGVAEDAKYDTLREETKRTFYVPFTARFFESIPGPGVSLIVMGDPEVLSKTIARAVSEFDPEFRATNIQSLGEIAEATLGIERLLVQFTSLFTGLALLLACIGLYGMLSYGVAQRKHEIGIRMALGAEVRNVIRLIMHETGRTVGLGIVLGLIGAFFATQVINGYLFGVTPTDPLTLVLAALLLSTAAVIAAFLPARRASRVDPVVALRHE